jgi:hypothetical protein
MTAATQIAAVAPATFVATLTAQMNTAAVEVPTTLTVLSVTAAVDVPTKMAKTDIYSHMGKMSNINKKLHAYSRGGFTWQENHTYPMMSKNLAYKEEYTSGMMSLILTCVITPSVFVVLLYIWWLAKHCCFKRPEAKVEPADMRIRLGAILAFVLVLIILLGTIDGGASIKDGADRFSAALNSITGSMANLNEIARDFDKNGDAMLTCKEDNNNADLGDAMDAYAASMRAVNAAITAVPLTKLGNDLDRDGKADSIADTVKLAADGCVAGTIVSWALVVLFSVWGLYKQDKCKYGAGKAVAFPVFIVMIVVLTVCLPISVSMADFCVGDPKGFVDEVFSTAGADAKDFVEYYFTCKGTSPFKEGWEAAKAQVTELKQYSEPSCILATSDAGVVNLGALEKALPCELFDKSLTQMIDYGICTDFVEGFYHIWVISISCTLLFWLIFVGVTLQEAPIFVTEAEGGEPKTGEQPVEMVGIEAQFDTGV